MSHHMINLDYYKTGEGTKQFWEEDLQRFPFLMDNNYAIPEN